MVEERLKSCIRDVPDWPKAGVVFKDLTTLMKDADAFSLAVDALAARFHGRDIDFVASMEARGFIWGGALAYLLHAGFVPIRKPGKLPCATLREDYTLEYGTDAVEVHADAFQPGQRVLICDDLLATGGTALAAARLVEGTGAVVAGFAFLVELAFLRGRERLKPYDVYAVIKYT